MTQYAGFKIGNVVFPLTASVSNSLLQDGDPALYYTLDYLKSMIQTHLGARFDAEMTRVGLTQHVGKASSAALPFNPEPFLQSSGVQPPFLALFPVRDLPEERTRHWYHTVQTWNLLYVLPAMDTAQFAQLCTLLKDVAKIILDRIENTLDPSWQSGVPFAQLGGIAEIRLDEVGYGSFETQDTNLFMPALTATLTVKEQRAETPDLQSFVDMAVTIAVQDDDGEEDLVDLEVS